MIDRALFKLAMNTTTNISQNNLFKPGISQLKSLELTWSATIVQCIAWFYELWYNKQADTMSKHCWSQPFLSKLWYNESHITNTFSSPNNQICWKFTQIYSITRSALMFCSRHGLWKSAFWFLLYSVRWLCTVHAWFWLFNRPIRAWIVTWLFL